MSLVVWLPLNGSIKNQGLNDVTVTNNGATINNSGKIGQCYQFGTAASDITLSANAMTSITTECSICFWIKILSWNTSYATFFQAGTASTAWTAYRFGFLRNNVNSTCCFTISNGSTASNANYLTPALELNTWYHIGLCYKTGHCLIYINGILYQDYTTSIVPAFSGITTIKIGRCTTGSNYQTNCLMNDFRIYDHCLSQKEVEELSKGLVLHYKFDNDSMGNLNILTGTYYNSYGPSLITDSNATNADGKWAAGSGGNGTFSVTIDPTCPVGIYSWNVLNNTSGNRDFQQGNQPYVSGQKYTTSFWAKGNGTCLYRSWNTTDGKAMFTKTWTLTSNWTYYTYTFTASAEMETDRCTFHLGVQGSASINICGMKMELGEKATIYSVAKNELGVLDKIYDSSGYGNHGTITGTITIESSSARYNLAIHMNNTSTSNHIECINDLPLPTDGITATFWLKAAKSTNHVIFAHPNFEFGTLNSLGYCCLTSSAGFDLTSFNNNEWNFIVVIRQESTYKLYINGSEVARNGANNYYIHNGTKMWLLNRNYNNSYAGNASISDFRIYATALTQNQILELYNTSSTIDNLGNVYAREVNEE